ncbi:hypothetical protein BU26DRAFT_469500 [Trematosphaeria pertusa]|uniref:Aminoglycoside phosphotransferase domain-containing protein n=1 Tax=Trematosphaeria pertusa TaxID=390896 RepID=A0A6A6HUR8_9PLEO|nr:uncharacterized protein BU26DRAFT_469500 [Trematosphaeria pertusa]KAF2241293.1 hypothetical protein BU26DRAFT_469500 [Trematosphaeria pertusa]
MSPNLETSFWERMGLQETDRNVCARVVEERYPGCIVAEFKDQGYCSFTLLVSRPGPQDSATHSDGPQDDDSSNSPLREESASSIVQIRPSQHCLDLRILRAAKETYGAFAPTIRSLTVHLPGRLQAFEMDRLQGTPFSRLRPHSPTPGPATRQKQQNLVASFATFVACAWPSPQSTPPRIREDSPIFDGPAWLAQCTGKVGAEILPKLEKLARELPDGALRERAKETLKSLMSIRDFPVVLCHGDLIPSNILVDEETWRIAGMVDWAEAEWLPFGTCLYGLEHLLGYPSRYCLASESLGTVARTRLKWWYYGNADELRMFFWERLVEERPGMRVRLGDVGVMRDVGVLLWLGYAWDEGRIDRVVNEVDDGEEVECLRAFLGVGKR